MLRRLLFNFRLTFWLFGILDVQHRLVRGDEWRERLQPVICVGGFLKLVAVREKAS